MEKSRMKVEDVEEFSAKVKSGIVKVDLLEAEVKRLKKFEEATGRLRNYNGELRHALVKAQGVDPLIQIPDDGGDSQLFSIKSVEDVLQNLPSFDAVVFNAIIMDRVFKNLDVKTIKKCRLICANWNEKASRMLSRRNGGYGLAVCLDSSLLPRIQDLSSIVASAPQHWFCKALLDKSFTRMTGIQSILLDFGFLLRSIEITGPSFLFGDVHQILVDWCPNLEQLALPPHLIVRNGENAPGAKAMKKAHQNLVFTRPLKLTGLFMQEQLCISIVKASPNLKTLSLTCNSDKYSLQLFKELQNYPEVTRNLENMKLDTGCKLTRLSEKMELFNSIQFSSKLKKLEISTIGDFRTKELSEALEKLRGSLEKLVLRLLFFHHMEDPELIFPDMNNLTELRYFSLIKMPVGSIEVLTSMPNLKTLYLGEYYDESRIPRQYFIDHLFSVCQKLRRNPLTKLSELYLFGVVQFPSHTLQMMNTIFPNLTKLVVGIFVLPHSDLEELKKYYTAVLDGGISKMRNLKDLYLDFRRPVVPDDQGELDYMALIFNHLDQLSSLSDLKCLTVRDNSNSTTKLVGDKLLEIPNLRQVTLIGLKLNRSAAKWLTILLYTNDIQLEMEDPEFKEDFRIPFEERLTFRDRQ